MLNRDEPKGMFNGDVNLMRAYFEYLGEQENKIHCHEEEDFAEMHSFVYWKLIRKSRFLRKILLRLIVKD